MGSKNKSPTMQTSSEVNSTTKPYLASYLKAASNQTMNPDGTLKTGNVAGMTDEQTNALNMIRNNATGGSNLLNAGNRTMEDTVSGKYLDPNTNPYLQATMDKALGSVRGSLGSTFSGQNFGSSAHQQLMNQQSMEAAAPILMQNYQNERGHQMNATANAPNWAYDPANRLLQAGEYAQNQNQMQLDAPAKQLGLLQSAVGTGMGGGSTTTSPNPYQQNRLAGGLGAASTVGGLLSMGGGFGSAATAMGPAVAASPWAWPAVIGAGILGSR